MYRAKPQDGIAWITGASSGIGRATALELARRGFRVAATARRREELLALKLDAAASGLRIEPYACDVTDRAAMTALVGQIENEGGPIVLALLNAGGAFEDLPGDWCGDGFRQTFELNFNGALNALSPLIPRMKAHGRGQIAIMCSVAGYGGLPVAPSYCASKSALIVMCESMAHQLKRAGIHLQIVCPGFVRTPLTDKRAFPLPFMIEVDDAARRICEGLEHKGFEIAFPRRVAWFLKALNMLPYPIYLGLLERAVAHRGKSGA